MVPRDAEAKCFSGEGAEPYPGHDICKRHACTLYVCTRVLPSHKCWGAGPRPLAGLGPAPTATTTVSIHSFVLDRYAPHVALRDAVDGATSLYPFGRGGASTERRWSPHPGTSSEVTDKEEYYP